MSDGKAPFRMISGWSYFEDHDSFEAAQHAADEAIKADIGRRWENDPHYRKPGVYARQDDGSYKPVD
jgi:hypothetical protein